MNTPVLPFTGERYTPECVREIKYEHVHRYAFATALADGKRVLDCACGEGYGSALLARQAKSVDGVDIDAQTIAHAQLRYATTPGLRFAAASALALPFAAESFDLIVSFETLEHLAEHDALLAEFRRVLAADGVLLVSTPDRIEYSEKTGQVNPFHVAELSRGEFEALLSRHFPARRLLGQRLMFASALWSLDHGTATPAQVLIDAEDRLRDGLQSYAPLYFIAAACARPEPLAALPSLALYADQGQSVYRHYDDEVRNGIHAARRIVELEQEIAALHAQLASSAPISPAPPPPWWRRLLSR